MLNITYSTPRYILIVYSVVHVFLEKTNFIKNSVFIVNIIFKH